MQKIFRSKVLKFKRYRVLFSYCDDDIRAQKMRLLLPFGLIKSCFIICVFYLFVNGLQVHFLNIIKLAYRSVDRFHRRKGLVVATEYVFHIYDLVLVYYAYYNLSIRMTERSHSVKYGCAVMKFRA